MEIPRGYRNNNPLNIRYSTANKWQGKALPNTDENHTFEQFISMEYGYRAAMVLIRNYISKYHTDTVEEIISKWAPANENNTNSYIANVCEITGFSPSTKIQPNNRDQICSLVYAMAICENGRKIMPDWVQIYNGWNMLSQNTSTEQSSNNFMLFSILVAISAIVAANL